MMGPTKDRKASAFAKFRLLTWKNFLQQWRHPMRTTAEVLLPVMTVALVLILRSQIEPVSRNVSKYASISPYTLLYSDQIIVVMSENNNTEISLAFSPTSPVLEDVVRSAFAAVISENLQDLIKFLGDKIEALPPDLVDLINLPIDELEDMLKPLLPVTAYDRAADLHGIYTNENITREVVAAIEFPDSLFGSVVLPKNMSYALRFPQRPRNNAFLQRGSRSWRTDLLFPAYPTPGPRARSSVHGGVDPGYVSEMFIVLQHALSTEIISRLSGQNIREFPVRLQRYPHPPYFEDLAIDILQFMLPMLIMLSFSYTAVNIVKAITLEKELQLKESMKIMGLPTWLHWTAWFCKQFIFMIVIAVLVVILLKVRWFSNADGFGDYAVFTNTSWTVVLFFLLLYFACMIFFCFMLSGFFSKASTSALFTGIIWFLSYIPAILLQMDVGMTIGLEAVTCLSINTAMSYGLQLILAQESTGGINWSDFFDSPYTTTNRLLFGHVVLLLVLDCVIYLAIALYLEQVLPGPYSVAKPWYFPVTRSFWCSSSAKSLDYDVMINSESSAEVIKEADPTGHATGIHVMNLSKTFRAAPAVDNLSLRMYEDQITVLLGHNGAGKSTTISMITGTLKPSGGSIRVAGFDVNAQTAAARANLGLCPQHNVLFNELTVREHLEFFARLKGFTGDELHAEIKTLVNKLELQEKENYQAGGLSGGQKRRLSVGVALCGATRIVLLDEPTSGMDPSSRRALWDLLQREKIGRTIILTTHFMDEADILGDRVAIMAKGRLQCVGSPYFLKRHYGIGYTLVVVKGNQFKLDACLSLIEKYIPVPVQIEDKGTEVAFQLKNEHSYAFEELLKNLEDNKTYIDFCDYGLTTTSMEDVFMSVGSDGEMATADSDDYTINSDSDVLSEQHHLYTKIIPRTSTEIFVQHVLAVWYKLWLVWIRSPGVLVLQILVPLVNMTSTLLVLQFILNFVGQLQERHLTLTEGYSRTETLLEYNGTLPTSLGARSAQAFENAFETANTSGILDLTLVQNPMEQYYLDRGSNPSIMEEMRTRVLIGATFDDVSANAWFSNFGYHDVATSLATVHSAILAATDPDARLAVSNHPLEVPYDDQLDIQVMVTVVSRQVTSGIGSSLAIVSAVFIMFYIRERHTRSKLLQKVAGIQPIVMWGSAAVFDWLWFIVVSLTIIIMCASFQVIGLSTTEELGRLYLCMMVYGAAMLPLKYLMSYLFDGSATGFVVMYFINVICGTMGTQIVEALMTPGLDTEDVAIILDNILQFFPLYGFVASVGRLNTIALNKWSCMQICDSPFSSGFIPQNETCNMNLLCEHFNDYCCVPENAYFNWEEPGIARYLIVMVCTCIFLWCLFMFLEYRVIHMILETRPLKKIFKLQKSPPPLDWNYEDADVIAENEHVQQWQDQSPDSLLALKLSKYYKNHLAVNQLSFSVGESECFGLLGVNGAGKTTTFKMLMGDERISDGAAFIRGHSVKTNIRLAYQSIGYCPQFEAIFPELTGRETLRLFSMYRGLSWHAAAIITAHLAHSLGFSEHLDKRVSQYSGGNKRKLSTAVAMMGFTKYLFLDEPTTGVDPKAKRQVWRAIKQTVRSGRSVVLTSHSMEECEALCTRLTIMVNGRFRCLGTPQHLKNRFSQGFTLHVKMKLCEDRTPQIEQLKEYINSHFINPSLMEEYQGMLIYYLPDRSMPWSLIFGTMENAKQIIQIEDYNISQTTLEQIFLQFARYQN